MRQVDCRPMNWRTFPTVFLTIIVATSIAAPFAAAQDEALAVAFVLAMFGIPVVIRVLLCWWVYNDAHRRGKSSALWLVVVILNPLLGAILWLMERDKPSVVYPGYYHPVPYYAPSYGGAPPASPGGFRPTVSCRGCGAQMPLGSLFCPSCGARQR